MKKNHLLLIMILYSLSSLASIQYTNIPDATLAANGSIDIDFDGDNTADFSFTDQGFGGTVQPGIFFNTDAHFVTISSSEWDVIKGLPTNIAVKANTGWFDQGDAYIDPTWGVTPFPTGVDAYIGAQFKMGANIHFGWIRVSWDGNGVFVVKDFAFEDSPSTAIGTGDTGSTTILVTSISIQGTGGVSTISTLNGTLQMESTVLPVDVTDNSLSWSVTNGTGEATISTSGLVTATKNGTVTIAATSNDGSNITGSMVITITNQSTGIVHINSQSFSIYPNPAKAYILIESDFHSNCYLTIYSIDGKSVFTKQIVKTSNSIDISEINKGIYILKIETKAGETLVQRLIKN